MRVERRIPPPPRQAFLEQFLADVDAGTARGLPDYQAMWPGFEDVIAAEFEVVQALRARHAAGETVEDTLATGPLQTGADFAGYRLIESLGGGGQGIVWRGNDPLLGTDVAIKILRVDRQLDGAGVDRFRQEAKLLARIRHPNVVPVIGAGQSAAGPYIVMQFVEGQKLSERIEARGRAASAAELGEILAAGARLARGLEAAHDSSTLHRDVKPGNVIIDPSGNPLLIDFGLARDTSGDMTALSLTGDLMGTPGYMSPEQCGLHDGVQRGTASDVFGLSATLYEWITGVRPFPGDTMVAYQKSLTSWAPRPARRLCPAVPVELDALLRQALSFDPADRPETAGAFAGALERIAAGQPSGVTRHGLRHRMRQWARRNPGAATSLVAIGTILTVACVVSLVFLVQALRARRVAETGRYTNALLAAYAALEAGNPKAARSILEPYANRDDFELEHLRLRIDPSLARADLGRPVTAGCPLPDGRWLVATADGVLSVASPGEAWHRICQIERTVRRVWADATGERWIAASDQNLSTSAVRKASLQMTAGTLAGTVLGTYHFDADGLGFDFDALPDRRGIIYVANGQARLWQPGARPAVRVLTPQAADLLAVRVLTPGLMLVSSGALRARIELRRIADGRRLWSARIAHRFSGAAAVPGGRRLVCASSQAGAGATTLEVFAISTGERLASGRVEGVVGSHAGLVATETSTALALADGRLTWVEPDPSGPSSTVLAYDAALLGLWPTAFDRQVGLDTNGTVSTWSVRASQAYRWLASGRLPLIGPAFSPDSRLLAAGRPEGPVRVWRTDTGRGAQALTLEGGAFRLRFADPSHLQYRNLLGTGRADLATGVTTPGTRGRAIVLADDPRLGLDFDPQTKQTGSHDVTVLGAARTTRLPIEGRPTLFAAHAGLYTIVSQLARSHTALYLGRPETWRRVRTITREITAVAFDASGSRLAAGADDGSVAILDVAAGSVLGRLQVDDRRVRRLAWFPDGQRLVAADAGGRVFVLDPRLTRPLLELAGGRGAIQGLVVSPNGKLVACTRRDGIDLWSAALPDLGRDDRDAAQERQKASALVDRCELVDGFAFAALGHGDAAALDPMVLRNVVLSKTTDHPRDVMRTRRVRSRLSQPLLAPVVRRWVAARLAKWQRLRAFGSAAPRLFETADPARPEGPPQQRAIFLELEKALRSGRALTAAEAVAAVPPARRAMAQSIVRAGAPSPTWTLSLAWDIAKAPGRSTDLYRTALALAREAGREPAPDWADTVLAACLLRCGEPAEARRLLSRLARPGLACLEHEALAFLTLAYEKTGDHARALACREQIALRAYSTRVAWRRDAELMLRLVDDAIGL